MTTVTEMDVEGVNAEVEEDSVRVKQLLEENRTLWKVKEVLGARIELLEEFLEVEHEEKFEAFVNKKNHEAEADVKLPVIKQELPVTDGTENGGQQESVGHDQGQGQPQPPRKKGSPCHWCNNGEVHFLSKCPNKELAKAHKKEQNLIKKERLKQNRKERRRIWRESEARGQSRKRRKLTLKMKRMTSSQNN